MSAWIWGRLQPLFLAGRKAQELHRLCCEAAEEPLGHWRGSGWHWDVLGWTFQGFWEVLGSGRKPRPRLDQKRNNVPVTGQRSLICCSCGQALVYSLLLEGLCCELGTARNGKQGIISHCIPNFLSSSYSRWGSKRTGSVPAQLSLPWAPNQGAEELNHQSFHCGGED